MALLWIKKLPNPLKKRVEIDFVDLPPPHPAAVSATERALRDPELPEIVFGSLHFQGLDTAIILPVIALFGAGQCIVYERTGSLFAVIAIHAAFNTFAMLSVVPLPAILIGLLMILGCLLAPLKAGRWPSPVPA